MTTARDFIVGEFKRVLDERFRLSIPSELADLLTAESARCMLTKERVGCLGLWNADVWQAKLRADVDLVKGKLAAGKFDDQLGRLQLLGRLLSTRDTEVTLAGRSRLLVPEGFREFLGVEPGGEVMVVGAGVSVEIWNPPAWIRYVEQRMPKFRSLLGQLSS
ncbi:MAG TPA: division/cell wall cluster transcriptional repressor MraZ [Thermoguttaceae bacterium]|nr:division/cell wall cluster transcriptional repressor MraZ [Thermoguttaceae bacterium]